ncbi:MAG TPA: dihydrolipoyl dehydrogenase [Bdellovibrionales bacterium]|nr:dihydrolipoyl dehydrogenase [Bdellovibrionales bacterium]
MEQFDVVVIGSGPGGYIGAIRAAQLGFKTAVVEKDATLGGTCLNVGCIPSKAMLESSHLFHKANQELAPHGIITGRVQVDVKKMVERKAKVVQQLTGGVAGLFKKHKITWLKGHGSFKKPGEIAVRAADGTETVVGAKHAIIATGSVPSSIPGVTIDEKVVVSSTGALEFDKVPGSLVVIGGGYIGLELGSVWSRLGSHVTVVEFQDKIIPMMDESLISGLSRVLQAQGLEFKLKTAVQAVKVKGDRAEVTVKSGDKTETIEADRVLVSVGRKPFTEKLGLENIGLKPDAKGFLTVDQNFRTSVPGVYAIGDVIGGLMLAHKAEEEGVACAELLAGEKPKVNYRLVPGILYTHPEVASVGQTEQELRKAGVSYKKGQFNLRANGRAISIGETDGFVKILTNADTDEILGAHILAPNASEMIHEFCLGMEFNATAEDIALTMHGHPTISESIKEAALSVHGRTLNA